MSYSAKLQTVYKAIKRERPWDIRSVKNIYTTVKEKYLIELIKDGHDISDEIIAHVVGRCYKFHHLDDKEYVCWFGFILTRKEYPEEHLDCETFHNLNKHLICNNAAIYYPVDILSNPFGDWHSSTHQVSSEIQEVYHMIEEKWPNDWYEDEMHKYSLKHLIRMIDKGKPVTTTMKQHVVNGCSLEFHELDNRYLCYSGFLFEAEDSKGFPLICENFHFRDGSLHYVMNSKFYEHTGIRDIQIKELRLRRYQTSQKITDQTITSSLKNVKKLYDRIYHRDLIKPQIDDKFRLTWQETYLMNQMMSGEDIPNEVISHVLDGCYTWSHLLTDKYACCRGYILQHNLIVNHDARNCNKHHSINKELKCFEGRVYHQDAEIPKGYSAPKEYVILNWNVGGIGSESLGSDIPRQREIDATPRLPIFPARPPQDLLDDQLLQQPVQINIPVHVNAQVLEQNDGDLNAIVNEPEVQAARQNARHNQASPPPEIEI